MRWVSAKQNCMSVCLSLCLYVSKLLYVPEKFNGLVDAASLQSFDNHPVDILFNRRLIKVINNRPCSSRTTSCRSIDSHSGCIHVHLWLMSFNLSSCHLTTTWAELPKQLQLTTVTITNSYNYRLDNWGLRRILHIHWTDSVSNDVVRSRTGQPLLSDTIRQWRLSFFGHLCRADTGQDHSRALPACIRSPPKDWRRRTGRPRQTWLRTVEDDLHPLNFGLAMARWRAMDRPAWRLVYSWMWLRPRDTLQRERERDRERERGGGSEHNEWAGRTIPIYTRFQNMGAAYA